MPTIAIGTLSTILTYLIRPTDPESLHESLALSGFRWLLAHNLLDRERDRWQEPSADTPVVPVIHRIALLTRPQTTLYRLSQRSTLITPCPDQIRTAGDTTTISMIALLPQIHRPITVNIVTTIESYTLTLCAHLRSLPDGNAGGRHTPCSDP